MQLVKARVQNYKSVEDSTEFPVDQVTCLLGKNEAGKSALLEALHKLNPLPSEADEFDVELDYPRRFSTQPAPGVNPAEASVLTTTWTLDNDDVQAIEAVFGKGVLKGRTVEIRKGYENAQEWEIPYDEGKIIGNLLAAADLSKGDRARLRTHGTVAELIAALEADGDRGPKKQAFMERVKAAIPKGDTFGAILKIIDDHLPVFLYFKDYDALPGKVMLEDYLESKRQKKLPKGMQIFEALLGLANTTPEELRDLKTSETLNAKLERVSNHLAETMFRYWSQNKHLDIDCKFQHTRPGDLKQGWMFNIRVRNTRHRATVSFEQRSSGFIWFFSFLAWFSQLKRVHGKNIIILLDEPGLTLHGRAQQDLLRYINEELRPVHQVLYSTHSPFSIDIEHIFSVRTVEDVVEGDKVLGTKVGQRLFSRDKDTLLPLEGICGFDVAQTMFVGPNVLVAEGPCEAAYLRFFSQVLTEHGEQGLDVRWAIAPAEGADKVSAFVSLFSGRRLNVAALMDYHDGQKQKVDRLMQSGLLPEKHMLKTSTYADQADSDIEDLLGRPLYVAVVNDILGLPTAQRLPATRPADAPVRVVKEVERYYAAVPGVAGEFPHYKPVEFLLGLTRERLNALPGFEDACARFERLFVDLNALLPKRT